MRQVITDRKKQAFARAFAESYNLEEAAIAAGYSKSTARKHGVELLADAEVRAAVEEASRAKYNSGSAGLRERIIAEITAVAFANAADYVRIGEVETTDKNGEKSTVQTVEALALDELGSDKLAAIGEIKQGTRAVEIKLVSKLKALELLGRYAGIFRNNEQEADTMERLDSVLNELNSYCGEDE